MTSKSRSPFVSVIVPTYNMGQFLKDAIASVRDQSWADFEIIVVDDGSTDETDLIVQRLSEGDSRIRGFTKPNGGLSSARNYGLSKAVGEFICFLDADDAILATKFSRQVQFLKAFRKCSLVYSDYYLGDSDLTPIFFECTRPPEIPTEECLAYRNMFPCMSPLLRSSLVEATGGFDESLNSSEDWDYWIRATANGTFCYLPGPVGVYRTHPAQMHGNRKRMRENQAQVIKKHFLRGSKRLRIAEASIAWADARQNWYNGNRLQATGALAMTAWKSRSFSVLRRVALFSRYG